MTFLKHGNYVASRWSSAICKSHTLFPGLPRVNRRHKRRLGFLLPLFHKERWHFLCSPGICHCLAFVVLASTGPSQGLSFWQSCWIYMKGTSVSHKGIWLYDGSDKDLDHAHSNFVKSSVMYFFLFLPPHCHHYWLMPCRSHRIILHQRLECLWTLVSDGS